MATRPRSPSPAARLSPQLDAVNLHAAGIDVGATEHYVAVPAGADPQPVRRFGACTADLEALADWLTACGIDTVAMESTGVYWVPLYDLLESKGLRVLLADARQTSDTPGRPKTDVKDCMWIQRLHSLGLLRAAFRPDEPIRVLRSYQRHRANLVEDTSSPHSIRPGA